MVPQSCSGQGGDPFYPWSSAICRRAERGTVPVNDPYLEAETLNPYHKIRDFTGARAAAIGSSDIPTLAGMTQHYEAKPYVYADGHVEKLRQTPYALYLEKEGIAHRADAGKRAEWGHRLEGIVIAKWIEAHIGEGAALELSEEYLAAKIRRRSVGPFLSETEVSMPERPYVIAHADLVVYAPSGIMYRVDDASPWLPALERGLIVEAKTSGCYAAKRKAGQIFLGYDEDDRTYQGIPDPVYLQVQWQMLAYDVPEAWVAVLIDTGDYREYGPIPAAPRVQEKIASRLPSGLWIAAQSIRRRSPRRGATWRRCGRRRRTSRRLSRARRR